MRRPVIVIKRAALLSHRWMGVAFCVLFFFWFISGIVMMYWDYPRVSPRDRLAHAAIIDTRLVRLPVHEAVRHAGVRGSLEQVRLDMLDGRPVYRATTDRHPVAVYADDGTMVDPVPEALSRRVASAWAGLPPASARFDIITEPDQWTVPGSYRDHRPLAKYTWPSGEEVYVSGHTGEVVQFTTVASRIGAYWGAIPHWLYFTPLRKNAQLWSRVVIWSSGIGTIMALLGLMAGLWMLSPRGRYRYHGQPSRIPYAGPKRLHTLLGLFFGVVTCTWAFSGMMSLDPFPSDRQSEGLRASRRVTLAVQGRRPPLESYGARPLSDVLSQASQLVKMKEIEWTSVQGKPVLLARESMGKTVLVSMDGSVRSAVDDGVISTAVRTAARPASVVEARWVREYETYYIDRHQRRPLPVLFFQLNDSERTMLYVDPKTASVVQSYGTRSRWMRWLYRGLHSMDLPVLYRYRPAWDIVVLILMLGGLALCGTSVIIGWRVLRRKAREARKGWQGRARADARTAAAEVTP